MRALDANALPTLVVLMRMDIVIQDVFSIVILLVVSGVVSRSRNEISNRQAHTQLSDRAGSPRLVSVIINEGNELSSQR
jgi:hypothetical protein